MNESELNAHAADENDMNAVIERVSGELRAPVHASPEFVERVMASVRDAARSQRVSFTPWWRRQTVRLSPAAALALAAGIAVVAFFGARASFETEPASYALEQQPASQVIRLVFVDRAAQQVSVVGSFNQWQKDATPLRATGVPGVWVVSLSLEPGMHEYAFVVDGDRWTPDPLAPAITDEFGIESSILRVQPPHSS